MQVLSAYALEPKKGQRLFSSLCALDAGSALGKNATTGWMHIAMVGSWEGHPAGAFAFDGDRFSEILRNFKARKTPVACDYEHDSYNGREGAKPASGYVKRLELREDGTELWGLVEWTAKAAQMIRDGEYRYCSPVVDFDAIDRASGKPAGAELLSVALTNNPFLDGQHPIQLTRVAASAAPNTETAPMTVLATAEQPKEEAPKDQPAADDKPKTMADADAADANALLDMVAEKSGLDKASCLAALMDEFDSLVDMVSKTVKQDGTPADAPQMSATPDAAAPEPSAAPMADDTSALAMSVQIDHLKASVVALTATVESLRGDKANEAKAKADAEAARIAGIVDQKIADGFILDASRDSAIKLFAANESEAAAMFVHKVVPTGGMQAGAEPSTKSNPASAVAELGTLTAQEQSLLTCMTHARISKEKAAAKLIAMRAGRNN